MNHKDSGYIFLLTLCIILVISLLGVTIMQHVLLYHKAVNRREQQHHEFYQLEHLALELARANNNNINNNCILYGDHANKIVTKLKNNKGCTLRIEGLKYHYFIEELGDFSCMLAIKKDKQYSTHHRRVSLMLHRKQLPNSLIQIRYLRPIRLQDCIGTVSHVHLGLNSWRYLASV